MLWNVVHYRPVEWLYRALTVKFLTVDELNIHRNMATSPSPECAGGNKRSMEKMRWRQHPKCGNQTKPDILQVNWSMCTAHSPCSLWPAKHNSYLQHAIGHFSQPNPNVLWSLALFILLFTSILLYNMGTPCADTDFLEHREIPDIPPMIWKHGSSMPHAGDFFHPSVSPWAQLIRTSSGLCGWSGMRDYGAVAMERLQQEQVGQPKPQAKRTFTSKFNQRKEKGTIYPCNNSLFCCASRVWGLRT